MFAPVAESVDALDLKSNWAYNPVPVQVWPGAILKDSRKWVFFSYKIYSKTKMSLYNNIRMRRREMGQRLSLCLK